MNWLSKKSLSKSYWNYYCDFFSMASKMATSNSECEERWFNLVKTAVVALDLTVVADQTKENKAAFEYHLLAMVTLDKAITYGTESTRILGIIKEMQERFSGKFMSCWLLPYESSLEHYQNELPDVLFCGVELLLRADYVTRWKRFRALDFKQQFPFSLDFKVAKKIIRTILLIDEGVVSLKNRVYQEIQNQTMCREAQRRCIGQGLKMYLLGGETIEPYISEIPEIFKVYQSEEQSEEMKKDIQRMKSFCEMVDVILCQAASGYVCLDKWYYASELYGKVGEEVVKMIDYLGTRTEGAMSLFKHAKKELHPLCERSFREIKVFSLDMDEKIPEGRLSKIIFHNMVQERAMRVFAYNSATKIVEQSVPGSRTKSKSPYFYILSFLNYFHSFASMNWKLCDTFKWLQRLNASENRNVFLVNASKKEKDYFESYKQVAEAIVKSPKKVILCGEIPKRVKVTFRDKFNRLFSIRRIAIRMRSCNDFKMEEEDELTNEQEREFDFFVTNYYESKAQHWGKLDREGLEAHLNADGDLLAVLTHFLG